MRTRTRRRRDAALLVGAAAVVAAAAVGGAFLGDTERIGAYWLHAHIGADDTVTVREVIDYDFGYQRRHGILRRIPGLSAGDDIEVSSPTAPDRLEIIPQGDGVELRVGDPGRTISNRHRYDIRYRLDSLLSRNTFAWNAIGDDWDVAISDIEIHVTSDRRLRGPRCDAGALGLLGGCRVEIVGPGHVVARDDRSDPGEFVTVRATLDPSGSAGVEAIPPVAPTGPAPDPGRGWRLPGVVGFVAALAAAVLVSAWIRRLGRERVWSGGPADAAFGPPTGETFPVVQLDHAELAELATIEFETPRDLSAAAGGIIHREEVTDDHKTAWLLECAIRDEIELETRPSEIRRGPASPHDDVAPILDDMFSGRGTISLRSYDAAFADGWDRLGEDLERWRRASGLWVPAGRRRRTLARVLGVLMAVIGGGMALGGAAGANRGGEAAWLVVVAVGAAVAGAGLAAVVRSWELRIRTAAGSGLWLRVESFRRFLENSEAEHVERAAEKGLLRQYTAWAVALDEVDHWQRAVDAAVSVPGSHAAGLPSHHIAFAAGAPSFSGAVSTASTAPSSSGGGGGGGAGGGGGGGGGGSW